MFEKGIVRQTCLVTLSPELLKLYKFSVPAVAPMLFTFADPEDSLDLLLCEDDEVADIEDIQNYRRRSFERSWGELELRLAFFSDILKWQ